MAEGEAPIKPSRTLMKQGGDLISKAMRSFSSLQSASTGPTRVS